MRVLSGGEILDAFGFPVGDGSLGPGLAEELKESTEPISEGRLRCQECAGLRGEE